MLVKVVVAAVASCVMVTGAFSQDGARAYHLLPKGTNIISLSAMHQHASRTFDPLEFVQGSVAGANVLTPSYFHSLEVFGNAGAIAVGIPLGSLSATLDTMGGDIKLGADLAQGDMFVAGLLGLVGSPSLAPQDYAQYKPGVRAGVVTKLFLPTGDYDPSRELNLGSNRWSLQASLPVSYVLADSMLDPALTTFELMPVIQIFGDNADPIGSPTVTSQAPLFGLEGHITRNFGPTLWASLDGYYKFGGETSEDGVPAGDAQQSLTLGATLGLVLSPSVTLRLIYDEQVYSNVPNSVARSFNVTTSFLF